MTKVLSSKLEAGIKAQNTPRTVESILHELVNTSNEPLYKNYRKFLAKKETDAEKGGKDDE